MINGDRGMNEELWNKKLREFSSFNKSSIVALIKAFSILSVKGRHKWNWVLPIIISSFIVLFNNLDYHKTFNSVIESMLPIQLAIFGIIFTLYSIILVFFSDALTIFLIRLEKECKNDALNSYIGYYGDLLYVFFSSICISLIVKIGLIRIEEFSYLYFINYVEKIVVFLYLIFTFRCIMEIYSSIYNTINLFSLSMYVRISDLKDKRDQ